MGAGTRAPIAALAQLSRLFELPESPGRILPMEGIRGLAVLLVFCVHYHTLFSGYLSQRSTLWLVSRFAGNIGHSGVDLFFILSGYLIYGNLLRKPRALLQHFRRRAQRIYPTFLCIFALYLFLHVTLFPNPDIPPGLLPASISILQNAVLLPGLFRIPPIVEVAWSLSYELFFYVTIPLVISITGMRGWKSSRRCLFFCTLAALYSAAHMAYAAYAIPWLRLLPAAHPRMLMFVAGMLIYEAIGGRASARAGLSAPPSAGVSPIRGRAIQPAECSRPRLRLPDSSGEAVAGILLVMAFLAYDLLDTDPWLRAHLRTAICHVGVLIAGFTGMVIYAFAHRGFFARAFSWTPLRWLGNMSYSYYLSHSLALQALKLAVPDDLKSPLGVVSLLPVAFLGTLALSTVLFALVEKPFSLSHQPELKPWRQRHSAQYG